MTTINVLGHQLPITDELENAFLEYYSYYSLPAKVKYKTDPKCKQSQWLYDNFTNCLFDAFDLALEDLSDEDYQKSIDLFEDLHQEQFEPILDQFEKTILETTE
jgi:hypothetical protein